MFDIGGGELLLILIFVLVAFGPKKIPELSRSLGRGLREFRRAQREFTDQINSAFVEEELRSQQVPRPVNTIGRRTATPAPAVEPAPAETARVETAPAEAAPAGAPGEQTSPAMDAAADGRPAEAPPVPGTIARGSSSTAGSAHPAAPPGEGESNQINDRPIG